MVSRSSVTLRLLPETRRGTYSVCDALGGERREAVRVPPGWALTAWSPPKPEGHRLQRPEKRWTRSFPVEKHNAGGKSTGPHAPGQGSRARAMPRGLAGPQCPSRMTHPRGITSEIPAAGRSFWRRSHPRRCCTPAATGSQCWSRCGARTRRTRSALWGWSRQVSGTQCPGGSPRSHRPWLLVPHRSPAHRSSGSSRRRRRSARGCPCSSRRAPCTRCQSVTART